MTENKHFKRRVRERSRRTGESYTAALRHLRRVDAEERHMHDTRWQRIERPDFGYAVQVPGEWDERPPNLKNSPWETARYGDRNDRRHGLIVFRQPMRPGRDAAEMARNVQGSLEGIGFTDLRIGDAEVAGRRGVLLTCAKHDAGRVMAVRHYMTTRDGVGFCLGCWTTIPDEDDAMFAVMALRFELFEADVPPEAPAGAS
ncbi:hypothetical protein JOL79_12170 [Microbispora sp. RL4-1S]|uniref:Uncharacterized protein n=1 Tax=Microbispora oryzae TaxID=2806554 RepID=A0A940WP49_9ACTN|nr:hypothetical protein [Microbispora oryzae]MBP2704571.1 hypothetical protein [Microbispora oryzae]